MHRTFHWHVSILPRIIDPRMLVRGPDVLALALLDAELPGAEHALDHRHP